MTVDYKVVLDMVIVVEILDNGQLEAVDSAFVLSLVKSVGDAGEVILVAIAHHMGHAGHSGRDTS